MSALPRLLAPLMSVLLGVACVYDLDDHPSACERSADCASGYVCDARLCVRERAGATVADAIPPGDGDGDGAAAPGDGDGDGAPAPDAGAGGSSDAATPDATVDAGGSADAGDAGNAAPDGGAGATPDAAVVAPYASCAGDADCNAGERCRISGELGSCGAPCNVNGDCPAPAGSHTATPLCDQGFCRMDCASLTFRPIPRSCPAGTLCIVESGAFTCYPN